MAEKTATTNRPGFEQRARADGLRACRPLFATLAAELDDATVKPLAEKVVREIDLKAARLDLEAGRLEQEGQTRAASAAVQAAERYHAAVEHTARIEGEFLGMLDGLLVDPVLPGTEQRVSQALVTIRERYGGHAAEHCRRLLPPGPYEQEEVKK